jgi:hypothetical protein
MRIDVKNYYRHHFGVFDPLTNYDIEEINKYELSLLKLPEVYYDAYAKKNNAFTSIAGHKELQTFLQKIVNLTYN